MSMRHCSKQFDRQRLKFSNDSYTEILLSKFSLKQTEFMSQGHQKKKLKFACKND